MNIETQEIPTADGPQGLGPETELSDEEIGFFREAATSDLYNGVVAMSRLIADRYPEVGTKELYTSTILARELGKTLGKDAVKILLFDKTSDEKKWVGWEEFSKARKELGEENIETNGVFGVMEGDDPQGPIIYIRGDMDALPTYDDQAKHLCGHNVHTSWLKLNCEALAGYKERFGRLPFKRAVFVGEVNEEGIASPIFGPNEMVKAGLFKVAGKPDIIIGSHLAACQPEGTVAIEGGATLSAEGRFGIKLIPNEKYHGPDLEIVKNEVEYQIASRMESEEPKSSFGTLRLVEDTANELPKMLVRIVDSKTQSQESGLRASVLKEEYSFSVIIEGDLQREETPEGNKREDELVIENAMNQIKSDWARLEIAVECEVKTSENNQIEFTLATRPGHVAFGGPNVEYFGSAIIHALYEKYGHRVKSQLPLEPKEIAGSIHIKAVDWNSREEDGGLRIKEIIDQTLSKMGVDGVESELSWSIDTPPVINDEALRNIALATAGKAGVEITTMGLPHLAAESFSYWLGLSGAKGLYLAIGGADRKSFTEVIESKSPIPEEMMHHNPNFAYQESAIAYGVVMSALAVAYGKKAKEIIN